MTSTDEHYTLNEQHNPWVTVSRSEVYRNSWIAVSHRDVIRPDGNAGVYGVVEFRNRATAIVPIAPNGDTWLVGQYRYTIDTYSWEVPEGGVPHDEDLIEGARRELREETGIAAEAVTKINRSYLSNSVTNEEAFVFVATDLSFGEPDPEGTEQLALRRVAFADALAMVDRGEITDGFSIIALLAVDRYLRR
jgi:8-oxo-dGTP pyrophosphatase MutT (NUDIX family)